jgi:glycerate 2-kinase
MHRDGNRLAIGEQQYDLEKYARVLVIGIGKASQPMGAAAAEILGDYLTRGILLTKTKTPDSIAGLQIMEGSHPVPDQRSIAGAQKIADLLAETTENDLVIYLISGGGSALLTLPVSGISLGDLQALTKALLACGATINEINCLRKHLSRVKGGQLARWAAPAQVAALILSDVIGDPLDVIASGPTTPDPSTFQDALEILQKYELRYQVPAPILKHLQGGTSGEIPETPKANDPLFGNINNLIIGNNDQAARAAMQQAQIEGFNSLLLTTHLQGEARQAGRMLGAILKQVAITGDPIPRPACIIAGGETTVTIHGDGLGGRNQEVALGAVVELAGLPDVMLIALATDGDDGPTDAAGAVVTGETLGRAKISGLDPLEFLIRNAAYEFFDPLEDLLKPGATQTNVNDLTFLIAW